MNKIRQVFGCDLRTLALFRICLGLLLLGDLADRARNLSAHYSDAGVLPRAALLGDLNEWRPSLHLISGSEAFQAGLFLIAGMAALALAVGYRTRIATIACWVLLYSLQVRNPMLLGSADSLMLLLLFWGMFLPLGARFSIDAALGGSHHPNRYFSVATMALLLQSMYVYFFGALFKSGHTWVTDASAVYFALSADSYATPLGVWIRDFPDLLQGLTYHVLYLELIAPFFMFSPYFHVQLRLAALLLLATLHIGFFLLLKVGIFPFVSLVSLIPFIPSRVWERLGRLPNLPPARAIGERVHRLVAPHGSAWQRWAAARAPRRPIRVSMPPALSVVVAALTLHVFYINLIKSPVMPLDLEDPLSPLTVSLQLQQNWNMFAPNPAHQDDWFVIRGELAGGRVVDLQEGRAGDPGLEKPQGLADFFADQRWRWYKRAGGAARQWRFKHWYHARYRCGAWNEASSGAERLFKIQIFLAQEEIRPDDGPHTVHWYLLVDEECGVLHSSQPRPTPPIAISISAGSI